MIKIFINYLIFLLLLSNCSINTDSSFWDNNINKKQVTEISFDYGLSYEEFKNNIIQYGKISSFPKLDN